MDNVDKKTKTERRKNIQTHWKGNCYRKKKPYDEIEQHFDPHQLAISETDDDSTSISSSCGADDDSENPTLIVH